MGIYKPWFIVNQGTSQRAYFDEAPRSTETNEPSRTPTQRNDILMSCREETPIRRLDWLTDRERVVLAHLMDGLTAQEIAVAEYVSICTVRSQITSILMKLGVRNQLAAVACAHRACWPTEEDQRAAISRTLAKAS
jgi:DNA-binding CsgD family transcriptional regulator